MNERQLSGVAYHRLDDVTEVQGGRPSTAAFRTACYSLPALELPHSTQLHGRAPPCPVVATFGAVSPNMTCRSFAYRTSAANRYSPCTNLLYGMDKKNATTKPRCT